MEDKSDDMEGWVRWGELGEIQEPPEMDLSVHRDPVNNQILLHIDDRVLAFSAENALILAQAIELCAAECVKGEGNT